MSKKPKGKNLDSLAHSRKIRSHFLFSLGVTKAPSSILVHDKSDVATDLVVTQNGRAYTKYSNNTEEGRKTKIKSFEVSGRSVRNGALSRFPQNVGRTLVNFYCPRGGLVYDPFAGHNSRMELVYSTGRSYVGVDVSKEFIKANLEIKSQIEENPGLFPRGNMIKIIEGSSASVPSVKSNSADFTITSPPYWDLEYYGDEPEQLGNAKTYQSFLDLIQVHVEENLRILKPGSFACWCINDFSKGGVFYPYHMDLGNVFVKAGFTLFAFYIIDLGTSIGNVFIQTTLDGKRFAKQHEYCLVARKPGVNESVEEHFKFLRLEGE